MINSITFKRLLHAITIAYICIGMFYFYQLADFHPQEYGVNAYYHLYNKGMDFLLICCIIFPLQEVRYEWLCLAGFFLIRIVWDFFAIQDYARANMPSIIFLLFCADVLCVIFIFILRIIKTKR